MIQPSAVHDPTTNKSLICSPRTCHCPPTHKSPFDKGTISSWRRLCTRLHYVSHPGKLLSYSATQKSAYDFVPKGKSTMWCNRHCVRPSSDSHASCQSSSKCTTMSAWRNRDLLYSLISTQGTIAGSLDHNLTPMARSLRHYCFLELFMKVKHNSDQYCPIHGDEARPKNSATVAVVPCTGEKYLIYRRKKAGWSMYPPALRSRSMRNCCTPWIWTEGHHLIHCIYTHCSLFLTTRGWDPLHSGSWLQKYSPFELESSVNCFQQIQGSQRHIISTECQAPNTFFAFRKASQKASHHSVLFEGTY